MKIIKNFWGLHPLKKLNGRFQLKLFFKFRYGSCKLSSTLNLNLYKVLKQRPLKKEGLHGQLCRILYYDSLNGWVNFFRTQNKNSCMHLSISEDYIQVFIVTVIIQLSTCWWCIKRVAKRLDNNDYNAFVLFCLCSQKNPCQKYRRNRISVCQFTAMLMIRRVWKYQPSPIFWKPAPMSLRDWIDFLSYSGFSVLNTHQDVRTSTDFLKPLFTSLNMGQCRNQSLNSHLF